MIVADFRYIKPEMVFHQIQIECMLSVSTGETLPGAGHGGNGSGMEADANSDIWSGKLW